MNKKVHPQGAPRVEGQGANGALVPGLHVRVHVYLQSVLRFETEINFYVSSTD